MQCWIYSQCIYIIENTLPIKHSTGPPAAPLHLVHVKSSNTLTTATITWDSGGNDVSYSTSAGAPFSRITQTSYTLRDLEVETDYVVSVTATNECGIDSPPSEEITVRIDLQGNNNYTCACSQAITSRCGHGMRECACIMQTIVNSY